MARIDKGLYAPSASDRPTGINRSMTHFLVLVRVERLQVANVPARDPSSHRRPSPA